MNVNTFLQKDYENEPPTGPKKQTQNKPNSNPIKACPACPEFIEGSALVLSVVEGVEWANFFKGQNRLPKNLATPHDIQGKLLSFAANKS